MTQKAASTTGDGCSTGIANGNQRRQNPEPRLPGCEPGLEKNGGAHWLCSVSFSKATLGCKLLNVVTRWHLYDLFLRHPYFLTKVSRYPVDEFVFHGNPL